MGRRGPAPRPALQVVREGNNGRKTKKELAGQVQLPPVEADVLREPNWGEWLKFASQAEFPEDAVEAGAVASEEWRRLVSEMAANKLLAAVDVAVLREHCLTLARIKLCEADIGRNGIAVPSKTGLVKNPAVTAANQYRTHLRWTSAQLFVTPAARARGHAEGGHGDDEDDDIFDV